MNIDYRRARAKYQKRPSSNFPLKPLLVTNLTKTKSPFYSTNVCASYWTMSSSNGKSGEKTGVRLFPSSTLFLSQGIARWKFLNVEKSWNSADRSVCRLENTFSSPQLITFPFRPPISHDVPRLYVPFVHADARSPFHRPALLSF